MPKEWGRIWTDLLIDHLQISQYLTDVLYFIQGNLKINLKGYMKYISNMKYFVKDFTEELCAFFQMDNSCLNLISILSLTGRKFTSEKCYDNQQN